MPARLRLSPSMLVAGAALVLALGGSAYAVTSFTGAHGQIHGCVSKKGQLTVLKPGRRCKKGTSSITWSRQGPAGRNGRPGTKGDPGAKGDTGPSTGPAGGDLTGHYPNPSLAPAQAWQDANLFTCTASNDLWQHAADGPIPAYYRDRSGVVRLKGYLKCPAVVDPSFTPMFQLPAGYRPDETRLRVVGTFNATPGQLEITGDGYVAPTARPNAANILISIDGISFRCGPSGVDGCP